MNEQNKKIRKDIGQSIIYFEYAISQADIPKTTKLKLQKYFEFKP